MALSPERTAELHAVLDAIDAGDLVMASLQAPGRTTVITGTALRAPGSPKVSVLALDWGGVEDLRWHVGNLNHRLVDVHPVDVSTADDALSFDLVRLAGNRLAVSTSSGFVVPDPADWPEDALARLHTDIHDAIDDAGGDVDPEQGRLD